MKRARRTKSVRWGVSVPSAPFFEFRQLLVADNSLKRFMSVNQSGGVSIDFTSREATLALTRATLNLFFSLSFSLPAGQLIPIIPGRVQYLRWAASLLPENKRKEKCCVLDIGCGPSAIYDLLGARLYPNWFFLGIDTDPQAVALARGLVIANKVNKSVKIKLTVPTAPLLDPTVWNQSPPDLTICNPPFFEKRDGDGDGFPEENEVEKAGTESQMETNGGEVEFVKRIAKDSVNVAHMGVFTSLVGVGADVKKIDEFLRSDEIRARNVVHVRLDAGKTNRWAVAWRFGPLNSEVCVFRSVVQCEWDVPLRVIPSRAYANRMTTEQVLAAWCSAMMKLEWEKLVELDENVELEKRRQEKDTTAELDENFELGKRRRQEKDTTAEDCCCSEIMKRAYEQGECLIRGRVMASKAMDFKFFLEMKVEEQSGMEKYSVHSLALEVCKQMSEVMDEERSFSGRLL